MEKETTENVTAQAPAIDTTRLVKYLKEEIKAAGGVQEFIKHNDVVKEMTKALYQLMLEVEMDAHLGCEKHDRESKETLNSRNGKGSKKIRGDFGEVEIETPRDREGTFNPEIVKKRQSSVGNFTEKIVSLYARGLTTREIEDHLREMYSIDVSPQFISRATERMQEQVTEWQNRPLESVYPVVFVDGLVVSVRSGNNAGAVTRKCVHIVLGVARDGRQDVLGLWIEESEGARFWLKVSTSKPAASLTSFILCGDGRKGLPEAVEAFFPLTDVQLCVVHQIRNATKFVSFKDRRAFCADMRRIYTAPTIEAAELALNELDEKWGKRYPMSIASWRNNWVRLTTFFKYPVELRKMVYTTNAIESLNAQLRKNTSNRKVFPNDDAIIRILFLNVQNFTHRWTKRQGWDTVMNQLSIIFGTRLAPEAIDIV